jgi:glycosyltransferase involved in cell wall biosynthesis
MKISIVSPIYLGQESVSDLVMRIQQALSTCSTVGEYEIILVEDRGSDDAWDVIKGLCKDKNVKAIRLSRNFGQQKAIACGLLKSSGDYVIVMDGDLQDPPEDIPLLLSAALEGWDIVRARRKKRKHGAMKRTLSFCFHKGFALLSGLNNDPGVANFCIMHHRVVRELNKISDYRPCFGAQLQWLGFTTKTIDYDHVKREHGKSTYNFTKLLHAALDVATHYSNKPLRLSIWLGFIFSALSGIMLTKIIFQAVFGDGFQAGWASVMVSLWFLGGLVLLNIGIAGLYIGYVFDQVKGRPAYVMDNLINFSATESDK